ncbi:MAG TPA: hypothetical protein VGK17_10485 [Propionicimonas sp.]|jgi:hypothetical protein
MAITFYAGGRADSPTFEIDVSDPGYGRLSIRRLDDRYPDDDGNRWGDDWPLFAGPELGHLLKMVLNLAAGAEAISNGVAVRGTTGRRFIFGVDEAPTLLPALTRAVILATSGQDRYERVVPDDAIGQPPTCVHCGEGAGDSVDASTISGWCLEHGHTPFGTRPFVSWEQARQDYARTHTDTTWSPIEHEHDADQ